MTASIPAASKLERLPAVNSPPILALMLCLSLVFALPLLATPPMDSDAPSELPKLVVFVDGGTMKVASFDVRRERTTLELRTGGEMEVASKRIARIVDLEPARKPAPPEPTEAVFTLRFDDADQAPESPYGELIYSSAQKHGLNPELIAAVVRAESAFKADAVSHKGARGLMQLMPATAARFGVTAERVHDAAANIDAGSRYLRFLADRFDDDLPRVLAAYNAGEGTVARYKGVPPYRETRQYIRRIFGYLELPVVDTAAG